MDSLTGFNFLTDDKLVKRVQWRFPRSRKTRIRRKWFRQDRNVRCVIDTQIYYMLQTNTYIAHPSVMTRFLRELKSTLGERQ